MAKRLKKRRPKRRSKTKRKWPQRLGKIGLRVLLGLVLASFLAVLFLRWINPSISMMMIIRKIEAVTHQQENFHIDYRWVDYNRIAKSLPLAVIASEDQKFPTHHGFDLEAITDAVETRMNGGRLRGASTISQQVAKNLFLWLGKSFLRKGIEAYFTGMIEMLWPKKRILEVYLNIAEMGDGIFGVEAASRRYFGKSSKAVYRWEAARLTAILPDPKRMDPRRPSEYIYKRARWIQRQVDQMGGTQVLNQIAW